MGHLDRKQWRAVWISLVVALSLLCAAVALWWETGVVLVVGEVVGWGLSGAVERPEIAVVESVKCGGYGAVRRAPLEKLPEVRGDELGVMQGML